MNDPLAAVAALPGVSEAVADARTAVDRLLRHRVLRRRSAEVSTESALRGTRASAALEGVSVPLEDLRRGVSEAATRRTENAASGIENAASGTENAASATENVGARSPGEGDRTHPPGAARPETSAVLGSPPGGTDTKTDGVDDPAVQGALRISAELGALAETWRRAPRQVLARLHVLAAADAVPPDELGRPRLAGQDVHDPRGLGTPPEPGEVAGRLDLLSELLIRPTEAPALVVAAIAHAELMTLRPFGHADGLVARAAQRLTLVERGLDPKSLVAPEIGHAEFAEEYDAALRSYMAGGDGVVTWIRHCSDATVHAARDSLAICEALMRG